MNIDELKMVHDRVIASKNAIIRMLKLSVRIGRTISDAKDAVITGVEMQLANKDARIANLREHNAYLKRRISSLQNELENRPSRGETLPSDGERIMVRQDLIEGKIDAFTRQLNDVCDRAGGDVDPYLGMLTVLKQDIEEMTASIEKVLEWKDEEAGAGGEESGSLSDNGA